MTSAALNRKSIEVFVRWRRLTQSESAQDEVVQEIGSGDGRSLLSISVSRQGQTGNQSWTSPPAFKAIFNPEHDNGAIFDSIVAPAIPRVLQGGNCNFFAYGHTGSGKTHTILGYNYDAEKELGLTLAAARQLFEAIHVLNEDNPAEEKLGIGFSLFEMRKKSAFDLLNRRAECHIREGADGKVYIRGETEMLPGDKVRVCPIVKQPCWTYGSFRHELTQALGRRAVGSSTLHDQSSRTHAILELEVICQSLVDARQAVIERQSELVPVGKRATDVHLEEQYKGLIALPEGGWAYNPDYQINQERIDAAEAEKADCEEKVAAAEELVDQILESCASPCLGAKMVFVDLAGAEYQHEKESARPQMAKQTPQERQEGRQINTDLLALKEVMRAWSNNQPRIPFRSSALTMVLREHFLSSEKGNSAMIVTVSPARDQYSATLNSLKYGSLVGVAAA
ncbi:hypothetical protein AYO21_03284 [Fonsecaea monophora]|uniref:Kinesin motor domain-containing protein n=1 Tax=Fonsecaea monophora TaxID=254056 RepID=A0A177FE34_9EURO|nr:hypothetical protein AYO21_03284 [Fonsecaea monophora]KAH0843001.1 kinesin family protein [Fonsecaea pedrosoi]OAG42408.1 hypothetical protein AYO21_03284 [Fonsecaea monophora]